MAILTAAPAYAYPIQYRTCHVSRGGQCLPLSELSWISGCKIVLNSRSLNAPLSPRKSRKRCLLLFHRASFIFDASGCQLSQTGQSIVRLFQIEPAVAANLLPESGPEQLHSESLLHHFSALPTEVFVATVALLLGTSFGYLISKGVKFEVSGASEPASEWLLVMNSTPFNRFVLMRCPSIQFIHMDIYEGLSNKLTAKGHHVVKIQNASIGISDQNSNDDCDKPSSKKVFEWAGHVFRQFGEDSFMEEPFLRYQRIFLHTKDGGVLAIDWPSHLELSGEHGLDTTILLVPGSSIGSKDKGVQEFVQRCVKHGYFPIVLNPRGCGGSPLTTPRLFTAGDSDDVGMAVEFVLKSRPSATMMAVGWGYGADMLVKYLGEEAASTPVTAAVCIENTFDLEESNKLSQDDHVNLFNRKMASGFVEILKSNQMVFEGKGRYFNVQKGLSAKTVREFDEAISIISKGYDNVHELYKDSSSKSWIANVKIPILCIQDNTSMGKNFSIPRNIFEENPFTTLILLVTIGGEPITQTNASVHSSLVIEWLAAVELAFLKGRHPLLQGLDLTFKLPSKERWFKGASQSSQDNEANARVPNQSTRLERSDESSAYYLPIVNQRSGDHSLWYGGQSHDQTVAQEDSKALVQASENGHGFDNDDSRSGESSEIEKKPHNSSDSDASDDENSEEEQGQVKVRQAAESVLKVLDVTMPGTLSEDKKEEVLEAVGRGETIVSALQEACPEDVREKMVTAVSAAVQARGISMKLAGFGKNMPAPKMPAGMVEKLQQKLSSLVHDKSPIPSMQGTSQMTSDSIASGGNVPVEIGDQGNTSLQNEEAQKVSRPESSTSPLPGGQAENGAATESSSKAGPDVQQRVDHASFLERQRQDNASLVTDRETKDMEVDISKTCESSSTPGEKKGDSSPQEQQKSPGLEQKQESSNAASQMNEPQSDKKNDAATNDILNDLNKSTVQNVGEASPPQTLSLSPPASPLPSVDISRAFEALTGVDDSTQMAVTNVFGVIENVLEQLEKDQDQKDEPLQQGHKDEHVEKGQRGEQLNQIQHDDRLEQLKKDQGQKDAPLQQGQKGEQVEKGQRGEEFDQSEKDEPLEQPSPPVYESSDRRDMDTQKQSSFREPHEDMSGQLGLYGGMPRQDCPGGGSVEGKDLQNGSSIEKLEDGNCFSNLSSESNENSCSVKVVEFDETNLALEYFEDENIWKLTDGSSDTNSTQNRMRTTENSNHDRGTSMKESQVINSEYVLLDNAIKHIPSDDISSNKFVQFDKFSESSYGSLSSAIRPCRDLDALPPLQKKIQELVMDALELELLRRLGNSEMRLLGNKLESDIELVSLTVAKTAGIGLKADHLDCTDKEVLEKLNETMDEEDKVHVDTIASAINRLYEELAVLPSILPVGILLGIVLAALSPLGIISTHDVQAKKMLVQTRQEGSSFNKSFDLVQTSQKPRFLEKKYGRDVITSSTRVLPKLHENSKRNVASEEEGMDRSSCNEDVKLLSDVETQDKKTAETENGTSNGNMMGAMAAAVGATAALAGQESFGRSDQINGKGGSQVFTNGAIKNVSETDDEQLDQDENRPSIVSTLAEKAMSVASPMVPTKRDGEVDHERLVEILAGIGQKGGILRFVGKLALLWGGLRGAMSLTDRLLVFLHISDRPLYQRITGFMVMVMLLWSPVLVPLLPTLLQQWASRSQNGIASTAALIGLYCAVVILINIWGRKIRDYEDPLHQYGVNLQPRSRTRQILSVLSGLLLGLSLVASVYRLGVVLQLVQFNWSSTLSVNTSKTFLWSLLYGWKIFILVIQCFGISLAVSFVEELFFRSWLQKEISADLGFHKATLISGLAFSTTHRSLALMPGLWFLSCILTGAKVRCNGDLNLAIGIHAGLMAGMQIINMYGQVKYGSNALVWFISHRSADPFTGVVGLSILGVLALLLYPWRYSEKERN